MFQRVANAIPKASAARELLSIRCQSAAEVDQANSVLRHFRKQTENRFGYFIFRQEK